MARLLCWTWLALLVGLSAGGRLLATEPKLELVVQNGHTSSITSMALSSDGKRVLTGSYDKTAILWDADSGQQLRTFAGHQGSVTSVALSDDGKRVLTASDDTTAILWDADTGKKLRTFAHRFGVYFAALSGDGRRVLTGQHGLRAFKGFGESKTATLWNAETGEGLRTFTGLTGDAHSLALSRDGKHVLTVEKDKIAVLFDAETGEAIRTFKGHTRDVWSVALSRDSKRVLTGSEDKTAILWDADSGEKVRTFPGNTSMVTCVAFSGSKRVLTGSYDKTPILWDADSGEKLRTFTRDMGYFGALSGDGKRILTAAGDAKAILWDAASGEKLCTFGAAVPSAGNTSAVTSMALSGNGKRVFVGSGATAILWDTHSGEPLRTFDGSHWFNHVTLSRDGKRVFTASSYDKTAILWDADSSAKVRIFAGHTDLVTSVALSADGKRVLTGSYDKTAILWDADSGEKLKTFAHKESVLSVALCGENRVFIALGRTAILWDADSGEKLRTFQGSHWFQYVASSRDGERVLTASGDETAVLWDADSGEKLRTFAGHRGNLTSVALSADGKRVLTASFDKTAILWDADSGEKVRTFAGHTDLVTSVALIADGKRVLTGSNDGTTGVWDARSGKLLCKLISIDQGKDWLVVTPDGLFDGSVNAPRFLSYRINGTLDFVPLNRYLKRYRTPNLLARLMAGEQPRPKVDVAEALPPRVRLISPASSLQVKDSRLEVKAQAESRGDYPVTALRLLLDGRPYRGQQGAVRIEDPRPGRAEASWTLTLDPGRHTLQVLADTDVVQGVGSQEVEVRYGDSQDEIELPNLYVLAVGISKYQNDKLNLDYAAADAIAVAEAYQTYSKKLFRKVEAKTLTDEEANRRAILKGLKWLRTSTTSRDYAVFFFSGHGDKDSKGTLFFLPHDVDPDELSTTGIHQVELKDELVNLPGKVTAILDACHAGGIGRGKKRSAAGLTDDLLRDLMAAENGLVVLCSATGNEVALENDAIQHGYFTKALLEGLSGSEVEIQEGSKRRKLCARVNKDAAVYLHHLEAFLVDRVKDLSKGQQHPIVLKPEGIRTFPVSKP